MKVAFRADASIQIGTGHVTRCLTLANELARQGHECWFVCREHPGNLGDLIASQGHSLTLLPAPAIQWPQEKDTVSDDYALWLGAPWQEDARQTMEVISPLKLDWLVVDHYALDAQWEYTVASAVGDIMVIDDLANRPHACALLLDQNLGRFVSDYDGFLPSECHRLVGPCFALLRPEFSALREQSLERRKQTELKRILISLGGVDRDNFTGKVLEALATSSLYSSTELDIIMGAAAPYLDDVRQQAAQLPFKTTVSVNVKDMAARMYQADLSIGAAGSTSWERCCMGLPSITVILAENQRSIAEALSKYKASLLVDTSRVTEEIAEMIQVYASDAEIRSLLTQNAAQVCDGAGAERIVSAFNGAIK
ncbi:UDP-2,4-diacetamido-2,4,6-trideoxy-beta-L-altropyranose hydrolase [Alphaproteobacteria bacterium LSUCC0396]